MQVCLRVMCKVFMYGLWRLSHVDYFAMFYTCVFLSLIQYSCNNASSDFQISFLAFEFREVS